MNLVSSVIKRVLTVIGLPVLLVVAWWLSTENSTSYYFPSLSTIASAFKDTWFTERLVIDVVPSVSRLLVGYFICIVVGVALGVILGSRRGVRALTEPVFEFFRALPPPVLIPALMLMAGIGDTMKILVIVIGSLWPILLNTIEGVRAVDQVLVDTSRCYGLTGFNRIRRLVLPAASPQILTGMRQSLSISIILMVISEMFASSSGLGFTVVQFQRSFAIPEMWSGIIVLGLLGFMLSIILRAFEKHNLAWYYGLRRAQLGEK